MATPVFRRKMSHNYDEKKAAVIRLLFELTDSNIERWFIYGSFTRATKMPFHLQF